MQHRAVGVEHDHGTSGEALKLAVEHLHAERLEDFGILEGRTRDHVLDALGAAERAAAGGRSAETHSTAVFSRSAARSLNVRMVS